MSRNNKIAAIILGAAVTLVVVKYMSMDKEEKRNLCQRFKERTDELLDKADETVDKVNEFMDEFDKQPKDAWLDKLFVIRKMFRSFYGSDKRFSL